MPLDNISKYRTQIGKHLINTDDQGPQRASRAQTKLLRHIDQYGGNVNNGIAAPKIPLSVLSLATISIILSAKYTAAQSTSTRRSDLKPGISDFFALSNRNIQAINQFSILRQRRKAGNNRLIPSPSLSTPSPNQAIKIHACFGHKIIFHHRLLQNALNTIQPNIDAASFSTLFDDNHHLNFDKFIAWYQRRSSFDANVVNQHKAMLEVMLRTINFEQAHQMGQENQITQLAYVFAMAESVMENMRQNGLTPDSSPASLDEVVHAIQEMIDQDVLIRWYDSQRWSAMVKVASIGKQGRNTDCRTLAAFQQKYQLLSNKRLEPNGAGLSPEDRQTLTDISLFWQKRLEHIWKNTRKLIHQFMQPTVQSMNLNEEESRFIFLPKLSLSSLQNQEDFRHQPTQGPFFEVDFDLHQGNFATGLTLFAHTIHQVFGASFRIKGIGQLAITLSPADFEKGTYDVLIDGTEVSYETAFDQLLKLSFYLDELTLAKFLYKALSQRILDPLVLQSLAGFDLHTPQLEAHLWAWVLHIAVCQEQSIPGIGTRVMCLLEAAMQRREGDIDLLSIEDDQGNMRHLNIAQLFDPQGPFLPALSGQNKQRERLLSHLPQLKHEYDDFVTHSAHCTCEISTLPDRRNIRSPQKKKAIQCSAFTQHLSIQLKNDPRYLAERDLIPRQEFESIKRYGVDQIDQIRLLSGTDSNTESIKQDAMQKAQEDLDKIMINAYAEYKKLRKKETSGKNLSDDEKKQMLGFAENIAADQQQKINKGIELVNLDIQKAFDEAKKSRADLQRSDFPELQRVQVIALQDIRPTANTPLLEIKIPTGGNFAETLSAVGKSILYVEGDLQLTYRVAIENVGSFDLRVMGRKSLLGTNDKKWRLQTKNSKQIQTKLEITGLYIGSQAPSYTEIFDKIKPLFNTDHADGRPDKEIAKFILDFMDKGFFSETALTSWSFSNDQIDSIKQGLTQWLLLQAVSEEQRTTGTYAEVKCVLQEYATAANIHDSRLVAISIRDNPNEKKAPRLVDMFDPEKKMFTFMLPGGARLHRNEFQSPSYFLADMFTPESAVKNLKQSRQIFENLQTSPIKLPAQPKMTEEQSVSINAARSIEQIIQHQDSIKALIDTVQPQVAGKRIYASTFSDTTPAENADELAAKKRLTVITAGGCIGSAHTMRLKRETCQTHFETQELEINNALFEKNRQAVKFLQNQGKTLNAAYEIKDGLFIQRPGISDETAQAGLNAMYAIQALMEIDAQDGSPATQPIIQLQTYLGWAQIAQSTAQDADSLITLLQKINNPTLAETSSLFGQALSKLGQGLQLASVGLDLTELATAQTADQRTQAGVKLFFDSSGLLINGGALIAEAAGFEGVAGVTGMLTVPIAGVGIGITALATQYRQIWNDVQQVGHQFDLYQDVYQKGYELKDDALLFPDGEVVTKIDFTAGKIERGSHYIYPTRYPVAWGYWSIGVKNYNFIPWSGDMPRIERNQQRAINLLKTLGWPTEKSLTQALPVSKLVLPVTPTSYLTPSYNLCPGATTSLYGAGFDVLSMLEKKSPDFAFNFYCLPAEYAIQHMSSEYQATSVQIILNEHIKEIFVPKLPDVLQGKMYYQITGATDTEHILRLNPGVSLTLEDTPRTRWVVDASSLSDDAVSFQTGNIRIGNIAITGLIASSHITVIQKNNNIARIDLQAQSLIPLEINEQTWSGSSDALIQNLNTLNQQHKLGAFVILDHHKVDNVNVGRAFYETQRSRVLYINDHNPGFSKDNIEMIVAREKDFYIQDISHNTIACISVTDGHIVQQYRLVLPNSHPALIRTYTQGELIFSEWSVGGKDSLTYYLHNHQLILSQVNSDFLSLYLNGKNQIAPDNMDRLRQIFCSNTPSSCADFVKVTGQYTNTRYQPDQQLACHFWIDTQSGNIIKPKLFRVTTDGASVSCQNKESEKPITLLAVQMGQNGRDPTFYFGTHPAHPALNDQSTRDIYIQQGVDLAKHITLPKDSRVSVFGNQLFVTYQDGTKQGISINGLSTILEKVHLLSPQKTVVVQINNHPCIDQTVAIPAIPGYETLIINGGQGQTYHIDQILWDNYATIHVQGTPACIQIDIHENNWLQAKKMNSHCLVFDKVSKKSLLINTSQLDQANKIMVKIGQRLLLTC